MRDRLPKHPGRVQLTPVDGQAGLYDMVRKDGAVEPGTPLNKAMLLPDDVCDALGLDKVTATPGDALLAIPAVLGKSLLRITAKHADGTPYAGLQINGITGVDASRCVTGANGRLNVYVAEGSYTLAPADVGRYIDVVLEPASEAVLLAAGIVQDVVFVESSVLQTRVEIKTTKNIVFSRNVAEVDVFCVGGGGGGESGCDTSNSASSGAGGGSGYSNSEFNLPFSASVPHQAIVGAGGAGGIQTGSYPRGGDRGGNTSFLGVTAFGGDGGDNRKGGNGGSGGGGMSSNTSWAGEGGTDGEDGTARPESIGKGQGTTTKPFGDPAELHPYAGGGGSAGLVNGAYRSGGGGGYLGGKGGLSAGIAENGVANTGGGGGGGYQRSPHDGGAGGSGIIIIRWRNKT